MWKSLWPAAKISQEVNKMSRPKKKICLCPTWISNDCTDFHLTRVIILSMITWKKFLTVIEQYGNHFFWSTFAPHQ
jgi:hypothetical protein